jgi:hypothetical protein
MTMSSLALCQVCTTTIRTSEVTYYSLTLIKTHNTRPKTLTNFTIVVNRLRRRCWILEWTLATSILGTYAVIKGPIWNSGSHCTVMACAIPPTWAVFAIGVGAGKTDLGVVVCCSAMIKADPTRTKHLSYNTVKPIHFLCIFLIRFHL